MVPLMNRSIIQSKPSSAKLRLASEKQTWNASAYAANSKVQQAWARELIARLRLRGNEGILDVGCGDGKITAEIARALPNGRAFGIDASPEMIRFAQATFPSSENPNLQFQITDARRIKLAEQFDIIFSNAALHWVDDHQAFLRGASKCLRPGGRLIVSCGGKGNAHDVFRAMRPEMCRAQWREFFRGMPTPYFFYAPEDYESWLPQFNFEPRRIELAPKDSVYDGLDGLAMWLRTTWLPFTHRVPEELREEFIAAVVERYIAKHPLDEDGQVHVQMVRLEIEAVKIDPRENGKARN
jgi:trans-aconitate 2-methyltransferase